MCGLVWQHDRDYVCAVRYNQKQKEEMGDAAAYANRAMCRGRGHRLLLIYRAGTLALRAQKRLDITVIPAAYETYLACLKLGVKTATLMQVRPDWCIDGADEIDPGGDVIKGRGGGLFGEKLIIASCPRRILLADKSKFVSKVGEKFPLPVEIYPQALNLAGAQKAGRKGD